jgi:DNA-binding YbaB/EbfC family protein
MDLEQIMKQAAAMQDRMQKVQDNLCEVETEGESGGGLVKVRLTGKGVVLGVSISPELLKPEEKEVLEDLVAAAFNDTKNKIEDAYRGEMDKMAQEYGLPANFKLPM